MALRASRHPVPASDQAIPAVARLLTELFGVDDADDIPLRLELWDGTAFGPESATVRLTVRSPEAFRYIAWSPNELGVARAYVSGALDFGGDVFDVLSIGDAAADRRLRISPTVAGRLAATMVRRGVFGGPPPKPATEVRLRGRRHSRARDAVAIAHHYDLSNDFYRVLLGETMTYSCGYWADGIDDLDAAQTAKYELICRKLGLKAGMRLLDVGCGWGGMALHAARHHGVEAVGVTVSKHQLDFARRRAADAGIDDRVDFRLQDYRDVPDGPFDAISSIGMFEHVGVAQLETYFGHLFELLRPEGRLLNHAISRPSGPAPFDRHSFIERYVFPDGELQEVGSAVSAMQALKFEVRDVESLREHYAKTLRAWVANLERSWDEAVGIVGMERARVWRLYMAGAALNFEAGRTSIHQVLGVKNGANGRSGMPATRAPWLATDPVRGSAPAPTRARGSSAGR